jgi:catechol 2,3-dioxygenase-like lactoylglutathione lyase family enzyme
MITQRLHHASFPVTDLERSMDFYGRVLGLEQIERPALPFPGAWYRAGQCEVHLIVPFEGTDVGRPAGSINPLAVHTAFAIDDYESVRERFAHEKIDVVEAGKDLGQMWVRDPDGNIIELIVDKRR